MNRSMAPPFVTLLFLSEYSFYTVPSETGAKKRSPLFPDTREVIGRKRQLRAKVVEQGKTRRIHDIEGSSPYCIYDGWIENSLCSHGRVQHSTVRLCHSVASKRGQCEGHAKDRWTKMDKDEQKVHYYGPLKLPIFPLSSARKRSGAPS
jgi:hypothetical protein